MVYNRLNNNSMKKVFLIIILVLSTFIVIYSLGNTAYSPSVEKSSIRALPEELTVKDQALNNLALQSQLDELNIRSKSYLVYEEGSGQILAQKSPDNPISVASLTKLMTALVIIEGADIDDSYTVTSEGLILINPVLRLQQGDTVNVKDLVKSILIGSANDAALTLGVYYKQATGQDIIEAMNNKAEKLEMHATRYNNPIGFDSDTNYSNANDIRKLLEYLDQYPIFQEVSRMNSYSFTSARTTYNIEATNKLISRFSDLEAVKTGFTNDAAGAMVVKLRTDPKTVIIVLNSADREGDIIQIRRQLLDFYK